MSTTLAAAIPRLFAMGVQAGGWNPDTFWNATPADLLLALGPVVAGHAPLTRADVEQLIKDQTDG